MLRRNKDEEKLSSLLEQLLKDFILHYDALKGREVFSEFLQSLFLYRISCSIQKNRKTIKNIIYDVLFNLKDNKGEFLFFYGKKDITPVIWIAPEEEITVLNSTCRFGLLNLVQTLLNYARKAFRHNPDGLKTFLTHHDNDEFSSLNTASCTGHTEIVKLLLTFSEEVFCDNPQGLKAFINQKTNLGFTAINNVCVQAAWQPEKSAAYAKTADFLERLTTKNRRPSKNG